MRRLHLNNTYVIKLSYLGANKRSHRDNARKYGAKYYYGIRRIELDGVEIVRNASVYKGDTIFTIQIRLKQAKSASLKMCLKTAWV
jgi:hypothetical protein